MPGKLGLPEILLILAVALIDFGPSKLADLGQRDWAKGIKNFKSAVKDGEQNSDKKSQATSVLLRCSGGACC